jgi:uncharacterized membrane protein YhaH (DUF805 family)
MTTPAGWYTDPENPTLNRYWNGTEWTEHQSPRDYFGGKADSIDNAPVVVGQLKAIERGFKRYARFKGRASRSEFWYFFLFYCVAILLASSIASTFFEGESAESAWALAIFGPVALGFFLPTSAVIVRRLHDTGKSGWLYWISGIPYIGIVILLILLAQRPSPGNNSYGPGQVGG